MVRNKNRARGSPKAAVVMARAGIEMTKTGRSQSLKALRLKKITTGVKSSVRMYLLREEVIAMV